MHNPIFSIVILNWNGEALIEECIRSVINTSYKHIEIIVVDNASTDASVDIIKKYKNVFLIQNDTNVGYAAGNNIGFKYATGNYIVTLNNDVIVDSLWLDHPLKVFKENSDVGIISCRQMQYYQKEKIDGLYHIIHADLSVTGFGMDQLYDSLNITHSNPGFVLSANGGSGIYRKEVVDQIGGFDENFFAYLEEVDLCFQAFFGGWKCLYSPLSVVFHKGSVSFSKNKSMMYFYRERNRLLFMYKNLPCILILKRIIPIFIWEVRVIRVFFKMGRPSLYFLARFDAIKKIPYYKEIRKKNISLLKKKNKLFKELLKKRIIFD